MCELFSCLKAAEGMQRARLFWCLRSTIPWHLAEKFCCMLGAFPLEVMWIKQTSEKPNSRHNHNHEKNQEGMSGITGQGAILLAGQLALATTSTGTVGKKKNSLVTWAERKKNSERKHVFIYLSKWGPLGIILINFCLTTVQWITTVRGPWNCFFKHLDSADRRQPLRML